VTQTRNGRVSCSRTSTSWGRRNERGSWSVVLRPGNYIFFVYQHPGRSFHRRIGGIAPPAGLVSVLDALSDCTRQAGSYTQLSLAPSFFYHSVYRSLLLLGISQRYRTPHNALVCFTRSSKAEHPIRSFVAKKKLLYSFQQVEGVSAMQSSIVKIQHLALVSASITMIAPPLMATLKIGENY
jgi:hypothetical protein